MEYTPEVEAMFKIDTWFKRNAFICEVYVLLENVVTSEMPSVKKFIDDGIPVYSQERRTKDQIQLLKELHFEIEDYYSFYNSITKCDWIDAEFADKLLGLMQEEKTNLRETQIYNEMLSDDFYNRNYMFKDVLV